jgi:HAMP domain-containing protein
MKKTRFVATQRQLNLIFTVLFVVAVIILTSFIKTSTNAMAYNSEARLTFTQARQIYRAKVQLQQFERALNDYELRAEYDTLSEYRSSYARLQQSLANLAAASELPEEKASLEELIQEIATLRQQFDQVIQAVDEEDWEAVVTLDNQAYTLVGPIFDQIDGLIQARSETLSELRDEVSRFTTLTWLTIALALPIFLVVVSVAALLISRQIHAPLIRMADGLKRIQEDRFDPATLAPLPERRDQVGYLAREFLQMAAAVLNRQADLQQEAGAIRAKIR